MNLIAKRFKNNDQRFLILEVKLIQSNHLINDKKQKPFECGGLFF